MGCCLLREGFFRVIHGKRVYGPFKGIKFCFGALSHVCFSRRGFKFQCHSQGERSGWQHTGLFVLYMLQELSYSSTILVIQLSYNMPQAFILIFLQNRPIDKPELQLLDCDFVGVILVFFVSLRLVHHLDGKAPQLKPGSTSQILVH